MAAEVSLSVVLDSFSDFAMQDPVSCVPFQWDFLESVDPFHAAGERKINVRSRYGAHHDRCKEHGNTSRYRSAKPKTRSKCLHSGPTPGSRDQPSVDPNPEILPHSFHKLFITNSATPNHTTPGSFTAIEINLSLFSRR